jgi:hypothetical protein
LITTYWFDEYLPHTIDLPLSRARILPKFCRRIQKALIVSSEHGRNIEWSLKFQASASISLIPFHFFDRQSLKRFLSSFGWLPLISFSLLHKIHENLSLQNGMSSMAFRQRFLVA